MLFGGLGALWVGDRATKLFDIHIGSAITRIEIRIIGAHLCSMYSESGELVRPFDSDSDGFLALAASDERGPKPAITGNLADVEPTDMLPWKYQVPRGVIGRTWTEIHEDEIVVSCIPEPESGRRAAHLTKVEACKNVETWEGRKDQ